MSEILLTERQSACRAAHEQVQMLQHLYGRLAGDGRDAPFRFDTAARVTALRLDREMLARKLVELGLLRTEPDPEREGLLEVIAGIKRAFGAGDARAAAAPLLDGEREFLRLSEALAVHDPDPAVAECVTRTRAAIEGLEAAAGDG